MTTEPEQIIRTPEQIAQDIKASHDSVDLINQIVGDDQHSEEINDTSDGNATLDTFTAQSRNIPY